METHYKLLLLLLLLLLFLLLLLLLSSVWEKLITYIQMVVPVNLLYIT